MGNGGCRQHYALPSPSPSAWFQRFPIGSRRHLTHDRSPNGLPFRPRVPQGIMSGFLHRQLDEA
ncbi:hypothetical protein BIY27_15800 [Gibbsiella quercinecans]|nr:hypothetical protein BIY27_15800 [Gibbsiella quercinecans]